MDIECKLKREGGTHVDMGTQKYHFAPLADGAHVAAVTDETHQDRFLGISEAYRVYRGTAEGPKTVESEQTNSTPVLVGSAVHPASFEIHGQPYALGDVVALAHKDSGLDAQEWNELDDATRADLIDEALDKLNADTNGDGKIDGAEEKAALIEQYKLKFGKSPGNMGVAKLRAALDAE